MIRELIGPNTTRQVVAIEEFNLYAMAAAMSRDGAHVAIEGLSGPPEAVVRSIAVYEGTTGRRLWSVPSQQTTAEFDAAVAFDPSGRLLAVRLAEDDSSSLLEVPSGDVVGRITPSSSSVAPGASRWFAFRYASRERASGFPLHARGEAGPLITFLLDQGGTSSSPRFSPDGRHAAWGHPDGTVDLVDLPEVRRRLAAIELGW